MKTKLTVKRIRPLKLASNFLEHLALKATLLIPIVVFSSGLQAQLDVTFEFESMFGKKAGYERENFVPNSIPPEGFISPTGVQFQNESQIVVVDRGNQKLQSCDDQGNCYWIGGDGGGGGQFSARNMPGTFNLPHGVSVSMDGMLIVADDDNHLLQVCTPSGACKARGDISNRNAGCSSSLGKWCSPQDTAVDSLGRIYGLDTGNHRIQILRADDLFVLDLLMRQGAALGEINNARGLAIDKDDLIIIADTGNNRIQICDLDENCTAFGSMGSAVGQFNAPVGVDVDALGRIWIADTMNHRIQACDYDGNCVAFGEFGTAGGQFNEPHDVAVHSSGRVAVADTRNDRIQLFNTEVSFKMNIGLNDAWYDPETSGQGFYIIMWPNKELVSLAWFTFDTEPPPMDAQANLGYAGHRWLTALGEINGHQSDMTIEMASGGIFDQATAIDLVTDGTIKLSFTSCKKGVIEYDIPSINQQGSIPIERIVNDNVTACEGL